jgi:hypothetical protein
MEFFYDSYQKRVTKEFAINSLMYSFKSLGVPIREYCRFRDKSIFSQYSFVGLAHIMHIVEK